MTQEGQKQWLLGLWPCSLAFFGTFVSFFSFFVESAAVIRAGVRAGQSVGHETKSLDLSLVLMSFFVHYAPPMFI